MTEGLDEYQKEALRTASLNADGEVSAGGITRPEMRVLWALGLCGEAGEFAESIKKEVYAGHEPDRQKQALELVDPLWYLATAAASIGYNLSQIANMNVEKLRKRYPAGFSGERSRNREESLS
ncbi:MAG: nucleoside triphosphate pyrophosphohydrolase family protein [Thermoplasmata archaeon]